MKPYARVFYAGLLAFEFESSREYDVTRRAMCVGNYEFYSGAYVYCPPRNQYQAGEWFRMDGTPMLLADVPKELLTWVLIL